MAAEAIDISSALSAAKAGHRRVRCEREERIQALLHACTPMATVLQEIVVAYLQGATTLFVADFGNNVIRAVSLNDGSVRTLECKTVKNRFSGDLSLSRQHTLATHVLSNSLYICQGHTSCLYRLDLATATLSILCGHPFERNYVEGSPARARFDGVSSVALVNSDLVVADATNHCVRRIPLRANGTARSTALLAGSRVSGSVDGKGAKAKFFVIRGVTGDRTGTVFVTDTATVRKIDFHGVVTTVAGPDAPGCAKPPAHFRQPHGIAVETDEKLVVADPSSHCLYCVDVKMGRVSTRAGRPREFGHEDGSTHRARFFKPMDVVVDPTTGDMYVSCWDHTIRKVSFEGDVSTLCGVAFQQGHVDDGQCSLFDHPTGLALL